MDGRKNDARYEDEISTMLHILRAERRRRVIEIISREGKCELRPVAKEIAAAEYDTPAGSVSNDQYQNIYVSLIQVHLETLDKEDVIIYNSDRKVIKPGPRLGIMYLTYTLVKLSIAHSWPMSEEVDEGEQSTDSPLHDFLISDN